MTHSVPLTSIRTQSDGESRENRFFFSTHITHLVPLDPQSQFCHLPFGSKLHVSRALKPQGKLGAQLGFFVTQLCRFSLFSVDQLKLAHSRVQFVGHVTGLVITFESPLCSRGEKQEEAMGKEHGAALKLEG